MPAFNVLLPVGISFYTFQALGYSIDVYYGRVQAERDLGAYALFVTFFPQLVAGPIERTGSLLPQFKVNHGFDYDRVTSGLKLAAWGMFKKVVIADRLALYVNGVYGGPAVYPATTLALATFFFAFQIYCDFSGYSDIAIGCARVLGFNLMTNFRQPYFAASIAGFWRRWHISLSTWFKDYLYIPLGGSRCGAFRQNINLLITFLVSGLWHGAAWHFFIWGALHGIFQIAERSLANAQMFLRKQCSQMRAHSRFSRHGGRWDTARPRRGLGVVFAEGTNDKLNIRRDADVEPGTGLSAPTPRPYGAPVFPLLSLARLCGTFTLVCFAWIFFRADSTGDAFVIAAKLTNLPAELTLLLRQLPSLGSIGTVRTAFQLGRDVANPIDSFGITNFGISAVCIAFLLIHDIQARTAPEESFVSASRPLLVRWAMYYALTCTILLSWNTEASQFIYFTF